MKTDRVGPRETEAGNGVMCLPAKECTGLLATTRRWERGLGQILRRTPRRNQPCRQLDLGLAASSIVTQEMCVVSAAQCVARRYGSPRRRVQVSRREGALHPEGQLEARVPTAE